jgi:cell wall-associated NlpC family hydrolase
MSVPLRVAACATAMALTLTPEMEATPAAAAEATVIQIHRQDGQFRRQQDSLHRRRELFHRRHEWHLRHMAVMRLRQAARRKRARMAARWQFRAERAVRFAYRQRGKPYRWGGTGPRAYDCSGLVQRAWRAAGVSIPRVTYGQYRLGPHIPRRRLRPGDLVFFHGLGHVGIYVGRARFIHSPHSGTRVRVESLRGYYRRAFVGAVRPAWYRRANRHPWRHRRAHHRGHGHHHRHQQGHQQGHQYRR